MELMRNIEEECVMIKERTWLTCREAAALLDFSQRHIINLIKKGNISAQKDEDGKYYIEKSEFFRAYPHTFGREEAGTGSKSPEGEGAKLLEEQNKHLQEMLNQKQHDIEFLKEQLSNFTEEKSKMLDAINGFNRLLEHKKEPATTQPEEKKVDRKWWLKWR